MVFFSIEMHHKILEFIGLLYHSFEYFAYLAYLTRF